MDFIAFFAAAAATWIVGAGWYALIGHYWQAASGVSAEQVRLTPKRIYGMSYLCLVLMMAFVQYVFFLADVQSWSEGLFMGAGLGAFVATPWIAITNLYARRPILLSVLDGAYAIAGMAAGCAVLGLF